MDSFVTMMRHAVVFLRNVWRRKGIFAFVFILCVAGGLAFTTLSTPKYSSSMMVTSVSSQQSPLSRGIASALPAGLSGFAGMFGGSSNQFMNYSELLNSTTVASAIMKNPSLMQGIYGDSLDPKTGKWRQTVSRAYKDQLKQLIGMQVHDQPAIEDVQLALDGMIVAGQVLPTDINTLRISCTSTNRFLCKDLLLAVHAAIEGSLRRSTLSVATRTVKYVLEQLNSTQLMEVRAALTDVLTAAETQIATSALNQPVGAMIIDQPTVPVAPSFPKPSVILMFSFVLGMILGSVCAYLAELAGLKWSLPRLFGGAQIKSASTQ